MSMEMQPDAPVGGRLVGWRGWVGGAAALVLAGCLTAACLVVVPAGRAVVITRFGEAVRVVGVPGVAWKLPVESASAVDLRLHITRTALQEAATKDGARVLLQVYLAWQVPSETPVATAAVALFLRAAGNDPDEASRQIANLAGAAVQSAAGKFALADFVNAEPGKLRSSEFEAEVQAALDSQLRHSFGVAVRQVGIERLGLPTAVLDATTAGMRRERDAIAVERTAEGDREAARIKADADRDSRILVADALVQAAQIEAESRRQAADIEAHAYLADPALYTMLRSMDTLGAVIGSNTRLVLRTDAAPFSALVQGPPADAGK